MYIFAKQFILNSVTEIDFGNANAPNNNFFFYNSKRQH